MQETSKSINRGYTHFGKQAEVWKHLPLCDVMENESPSVYLETNSAYADYLLERTPEQEYGIFHFIDKGQCVDELKNTTYYQLESSAMQKSCYLGSPALAMSILQDKVDNYIFFDIDKEALNNISRFSSKLGLVDKIELRNQDPRIGLRELLKKLPASTLIHIDPYEILEPVSNGYSYLDLFIEASDLGVKCFLWYGFNTLDEKRKLDEAIKLEVQKSVSKDFLCKELIMEIITTEPTPVNPGIVGSGLLASNLSKKSFDAIEKYSHLLVDLWKDTTYRNCRGDLYQETIIK
jgi:23S rRNA (adenine2030-N6)-methyltransferase